MSREPRDVNGAETGAAAASERAEPLPAGPYRIATISELASVPEPTLRAWERRYGVPSPDRSAGGYRLYGAAELEEIRTMRRLCDEGMAASEAADFVKSRRERHEESAPRLSHLRDPFEALVDMLLEAIENFDDAGIEAVLRRVMMSGSALAQVDHVLTPALRIIGDRWHAGELSVAQEHLASNRIGTHLRDLLRVSDSAPLAGRVVLGSFADDEHDLGLFGTAIRFAAWNFRPIVLGARTPPAAVRSAVEASRPVLVAMSMTVPPPRARARELIEEYGRAVGNVPWLVGGPAVQPFAELIARFGGIVAADRAEALRDQIREVLVARLNETTRKPALGKREKP